MSINMASQSNQTVNPPQNQILDLDKKISNLASIPKIPKEIDLDKEIPNYTQQISNKLLTNAEYLTSDVNRSMENIKQVAGNFLSDKWNQAKFMMQGWSVGAEDNQTPQYGGRNTKKKRISRRKLNKKSNTSKKTLQKKKRNFRKRK